MADLLWMLAYVLTGAGIALAGYWVGLLRGRAEGRRNAQCADAEFREVLTAHFPACTCAAAHLISFPPPPQPGFAARRKGERRDA